MKYLVATLILLGLFSPAEARQRHAQPLDPGCNIIFPCTPMAGQRVVGSSLFDGIRSIKVTMHRERIMSPRHKQVSENYPAGIPEKGLVRSASGATAHVAVSAVSAFQCIVIALERQGYPIKFMGGWKIRGSVPKSLHPLGLALDINQVARNVTKPPMPSNEIALANNCGLTSGAQWTNADSGHFQVGSQFKQPSRSQRTTMQFSARFKRRLVSFAITRPLRDVGARLLNGPSVPCELPSTIYRACSCRRGSVPIPNNHRAKSPR